MNPETGTFISMDTYRGNAYDPASLHRYTYAQNNPQMYNDPSGHFVGLIGTCVSSACQSILSSWKGIALNALLGGAVNTIINQVLDTGESEIKSFVKGALVGGGFAAAYIGVCAIAAIFEVQALVHLSIGVLCIIGAFIEFGMSGKITANGARGSATIEVGGNNTANSKTYYQVTSKENASALINSDNPSLKGTEFKEVYVWTEQPTLKQAKNSGARYLETVIKFETNATFSRDTSIVDSSLWDIARVSDRPGPISISNVIEVGFEINKGWWQFWIK